MKKYAIYASGKCTRIKKAIEAYPYYSKQIGFIIVDEKEDLELKEWFEKRKIKYYSFDLNLLPKTEDRNLILSDFICDKLQDEMVDYCLSFGRHILKGNLLSKFEYRLINFHPGIIPEVTGLHAIDKAIFEKKRYIGNTVHFIDSGIDSGPIIMQNLILAENFDKYGYDLYLDAQIELIDKTIKLLDAERIIVKDGKVRIKEANYTISQIYPKFEV